MVRSLFPLLLIAIVAVAVYAVQKSRHSGSTTPHTAPTLEAEPPSVVTSPPTPARRSLPGSPDPAADLDRWVAAGLISDEQSSVIKAYERQLLYPAAPLTAIVPTPRRRVPPIAEALGYLGGVLATTGLILLVAQYWQDVATAGRWR